MRKRSGFAAAPHLAAQQNGQSQGFILSCLPERATFGSAVGPIGIIARAAGLGLTHSNQELEEMFGEDAMGPAPCGSMGREAQVLHALFNHARAVSTA
ncbi:MAG TPA: hypothetical protein VE999_21835 [Gemmataceae bacterium]|nr:hypothetical protein [Gemmataceae bacterium]